MTSILGSGDPAFYHSDRDAAEAERELQIAWEDLQYPNGEVGCRDCEQPFDPATMYDEVEGGLTFKICGMCGGAGAQSYRLNFEPSAYGVDPYKEFGIAKDFEMGHEPAKPGDPAFHYSDRDQAEEERNLQIKYEDSIFADGRRSCYDCETVQDGEVMEDWYAEEYIWKLCSSCFHSRNIEAMRLK